MSLLIGASSPAQGASGAQGAAADLGDTIDQSLRFRGTQTLIGPTSLTSTTFTWSGWVKLGSRPLNNTAYIFACTNDTRANQLLHSNTGTLVSNGGTPTATSTSFYRDPGAWYHFVFSCDAGTSTVFCNGEVVPGMESFASPALNAPMGIGCFGTALTNNPTLFEGYFAAVYFIDGQALDPTNFGKYNDDGVWVPQDYTGTYGTNGFHLTFDSSQTNGIGHDSSGNNNHFTATGFETTAISSSNTDNDIDYEDTPTSNHATGNPLHPHSTSSWSKANLTVANPQDSYFRGNFQLPSSGKFYWEINNDGDGSTNAQAVVYGITNPGGPDTNNLTTSAFWRSAAFFDGTAAVAVDMDAGEIWFAENNTWASGDPSAGTSPSHTDLLTAYDPVEWFPLFGGYRSVNYSINFGQMPFQYTPPTGFSALQTNNLPEPTIKNGKDHFEAVTWSGDGTSPRTISTQFQPDLVWIKSRSSATSHFLYDSVRGFGASKELSSDNTREEGNSSTNTAANGYVSGVTSSGFTLTAGTSGDNYTNDGSRTYVGWAWKAGGTAVSNTDGTITSSVSANTDAGFSIVSYTASGAGTVGHGLNKAPELVIIKRRDSTSNWPVFVKQVFDNIGSNQALFLDQFAAAFAGATYFNSTAPTSTVFSVGSAADTSGGTHVAYCWHSVEGYSKFGSYEGNGSSDGPFVYTGFKVAWLLLKSADATGGWMILDTTRTPNNVMSEYLSPNANYNESSSSANHRVDLLSNGFKIRTAGGTDPRINPSGGTVIYAAFAESPFGGENAPPATAR